MDVKFFTSDYADRDQVPVANGQFLAISDRDELYYDMGGSRHLVSGVRAVSALPSTGVSGIIYVVITSDGRAVVSVWNESANAFVACGGQVSREITKAQYAQLPASQKTGDYIYYVTDATSASDLT